MIHSFLFQYTEMITDLAGQAKSVVRGLDPTNELEYVRVRSRKHEIMIAPDNAYTLYVIQAPQTEVQAVER